MDNHLSPACSNWYKFNFSMENFSLTFLLLHFLYPPHHKGGEKRIVQKIPGKCHKPQNHHLAIRPFMHCCNRTNNGLPDILSLSILVEDARNGTTRWHIKIFSHRKTSLKNGKISFNFIWMNYSSVFIPLHQFTFNQKIKMCLLMLLAKFYFRSIINSLPKLPGRESIFNCSLSSCSYDKRLFYRF